MVVGSFYCQTNFRAITKPHSTYLRLSHSTHFKIRLLLAHPGAKSPSDCRCCCHCCPPWRKNFCTGWSNGILLRKLWYSGRRLEWQRLLWQLATVTVLVIPDSFSTIRVTVGYSDTFADTRGCHCNRRPLYRAPRLHRLQWHSKEMIAYCDTFSISRLTFHIHPIPDIWTTFVPAKMIHIS